MKTNADVVDAYIKNLTLGDVERVLSLYTANAVIEDPVGTPLKNDAASIRAFYDEGKELSVTANRTGATRSVGNCVAFPLTIAFGPDTVLDVIEIMTFDTSNRIQQMRAFWGEPNPVKITTIENFLVSLNDHNDSAIETLFADDATIEDPVGSTLQSGLTGARRFYHLSSSMHWTASLAGSVRCADRYAAFPLHIETNSHAGRSRLEVISLIEFNEHGKIAALQTFWGDDNRVPLD